MTEAQIDSLLLDLSIEGIKYRPVYYGVNTLRVAWAILVNDETFEGVFPDYNGYWRRFEILGHIAQKRPLALELEQQRTFLEIPINRRLFEQYGLWTAAFGGKNGTKLLLGLYSIFAIWSTIAFVRMAKTGSWTADDCAKVMVILVPGMLCLATALAEYANPRYRYPFLPIILAVCVVCCRSILLNIGLVWESWQQNHPARV